MPYQDPQAEAVAEMGDTQRAATEGRMAALIGETNKAAAAEFRQSPKGRSYFAELAKQQDALAATRIRRVGAIIDRLRAACANEDTFIDKGDPLIRNFRRELNERLRVQDQHRAVSAAEAAAKEAA